MPEQPIVRDPRSLFVIHDRLADLMDQVAEAAADGQEPPDGLIEEINEYIQAFQFKVDRIAGYLPLAGVNRLDLRHRSGAAIRAERAAEVHGELGGAGRSETIKQSCQDLEPRREATAPVARRNRSCSVGADP